MLLRDLNDFNKWKETMEDKKDTIINGINQTQQARVMDEIEQSQEKAASVFVCDTGDLILVQRGNAVHYYYSTKVINETRNILQHSVEQIKLQTNYWKSRSEDIESAFNLQKHSIERADQVIKDLRSQVDILERSIKRSPRKRSR